MKFIACLITLALRPALAQQPLEVRRGELQVKVHVSGTIVASDVVRLRSTIDGRVEDILTSTGGWVLAGRPLGHLANKEMAAIFDSHSTTEKGILEERWRRVYAPTPILCPGDCYVLRRFAKAKDWLRPKALLFEAAQKLLLVARVRPEDAHWIRDGQLLTFWDVNNPQRKLQARVGAYVLDIQGAKAEPGGSFMVSLPPTQYLDPGTRWEGLIIPLTKKNVLMVPTAALINHAEAIYLPVRVSTGITTDEWTEIAAGVEHKRQVLVLDDAQLKTAQRHKTAVDMDAINKRLLEQQKLEAQPQERSTILTPLSDPDANYSEDPNGR